MKVVLNIICIFAFILINSQNKRFFYEHTFADDSTNVGVKSKKLMVLDIGKDGSKYYAYEILAEDSLKILKESRQGKYLYQGMQNTDIILKKYPSYEYNLYTNLISVDYKIVYKKGIKWEIESEAKKLNGYKVQKATTILYNRKWIAWYAIDIPIQDGPYLFHGLPGLILKVEDELQSQIFELSGIKNLKSYNEENIPYYFDKRLVTIDDKKWTKLLKDFIDNPLQQNHSDNSPNNTYHLQDGTIVSKSEFIRMQENSLKEIRKRNNNLLRFEYLR